MSNQKKKKEQFGVLVSKTRWAPEHPLVLVDSDLLDQVNHWWPGKISRQMIETGKWNSQLKTQYLNIYLSATT